MELNDNENGVKIDLSYEENFPVINIEMNGHTGDLNRPSPRVMLNGVCIHEMFDHEEPKDYRWQPEAEQKLPAKPVTNTFLLKAVDNHDFPKLPDISLFLIEVVFVKGESGLATCVEKLSAAFKEWSETKKGREFIEENGKNFGDATSIPEYWLNKHGIVRYVDAAGVGYCKPGPQSWDNEMVVDHNEDLF